MGTSTDAILAYGVDLGEDVPAWLWKAMGMTSRDLNEYGETVDTGDLAAALEKQGMALVHHCSDSCTMYVLAVGGSEVTAWRGQPRKIKTLAEPGLPPQWPAKAKRPAWLLFSWLG